MSEIVKSAAKADWVHPVKQKLTQQRDISLLPSIKKLTVQIGTKVAKYQFLTQSKFVLSKFYTKTNAQMSTKFTPKVPRGVLFFVNTT